MALQFRPPDTSQFPDKYAALNQTVGQTIATLPQQYAAYKLQRQQQTLQQKQLEAQIAQHEAEQKFRGETLSENQRHNQAMENIQYVIPTQDEQGNVVGYSPVPAGMKPYGGGKPQKQGKAGTGGPGIKGQDVVDKSIGQAYAKNILGENTTSIQNLNDLADIASDLTTGKVKTGGIGGTLLPEPAQRVLTKKISDARQRIQTVIFPTLKQFMGTQFTENEGKRVVNATFDSAQPSSVNAQRALRLKNILEKQALARQQVFDYFGIHGTMSGYNSPVKLEMSADDIISQLKTPVREQATPTSGPMQLSTNEAEADQQYNSLPSGSEFIGPDGIKRRKP